MKGKPTPALRLDAARRGIVSLLATVGRPLTAGEIGYNARPHVKAAERDALIAALVSEGRIVKTTVPYKTHNSRSDMGRLLTAYRFAGARKPIGGPLDPRD